MTSQEINRKIAKVILRTGVALGCVLLIAFTCALIVLVVDAITGDRVARIVLLIGVCMAAFGYAMDWATNQLEEEPTNEQPNTQTTDATKE